jgi:hypothetical protein
MLFSFKKLSFQLMNWIVVDQSYGPMVAGKEWVLKGAQVVLLVSGILRR